MTTDEVQREVGEPIPTEDAMVMLSLFTKVLMNRLTPFRRMVELPYEELEEAGELHINVQPQDTHILLTFVDGPPPPVPTFTEPKPVAAAPPMATGAALNRLIEKLEERLRRWETEDTQLNDLTPEWSRGVKVATEWALEDARMLKSLCVPTEVAARQDAEVEAVGDTPYFGGGEAA